MKNNKGKDYITESNWKYNDTKVKIDKLPDPKLHQLISFIKSGIRIIGYAFIPFSLFWAVIFLILSEVIGIAEELA